MDKPRDDDAIDQCQPGGQPDEDDLIGGGPPTPESPLAREDDEA